MTISLNPEHQKLIEEKVQAGEFPSAEAAVEFALNRFLVPAKQRELVLTAEEGIKALDEFFAEVDRDSVSESGPLPAEALRRESLYDDHRNRR